MKLIVHSTSRRLVLIIALMCPVLGTHAAEQSAERQTALTAIAALDKDLTQLALEIWQYAETALTEQQSSATLSNFLQSRGFSIERGVAGLPTAFVAEWGTGKPVIAVMAEFDALPGVGNAVVPTQTSRDDGVTSGHGCAHNIFGSGSIGAALGIKEAMAAHDIPGTVRLYGAPAEETLVGKVYMAKAGVFDDVDAVLDWHPSIRNGIKNQSGQAMNNFTVEFFGKAAHGAYDPWNGRSALDALEMTNFGINLMREHIEPTARIHYVIENGGKVPNVVPDYTRAWYYVRDIDREKVDAHFAWIRNIVDGAAQATQTEYKTSLTTGVHQMLLNRPLQEAAHKNYQAVGPPPLNDVDQTFAKELQTGLGLEASGISTELEPLADTPQPTRGGSTDVAEVSWIAPTVTIYVAAAAKGIPWHSWAVAASAGTVGASKAAHTAARVLALTGIDVLTDAKLLAAAKAEFIEKTHGQPYRSPIPVDQAPPLPDS